MFLCKLGSEHSSQGEPLARVSVVRDRYAVGLRVVDNAVNARHLVAAYALDGQLGEFTHICSLHGAVGQMLLSLDPCGLAVEVVDDLLCQRYGCA